MERIGYSVRKLGRTIKRGISYKAVALVGIGLLGGVILEKNHVIDNVEDSDQAKAVGKLTYPLRNALYDKLVDLTVFTNPGPAPK